MNTVADIRNPCRTGSFMKDFCLGNIDGEMDNVPATLDTLSDNRWKNAQQTTFPLFLLSENHYLCLKSIYKHSI